MTIRELIVRLGFKVDSQSLSRWERRVETAKRRMLASKKAAQAFAQAVRKLALGAGVAAGAMLSLVKKVADVGDQAAKDARKLGLTAEAIQELSHAAKLSGSDVSTMKTGLQALARGLNDATTKGTGPASEAFEQLGVSLTDPAVKSNDLNQVMELVADRFAAMPDGAKKTALAMKLFSRSGAELIPLLNGGSRGIAEMRREARDLGLVMSNEAAEESERFNDDLERLKGTVFGVATEVATRLMPTIRRWIGTLRTWIRENRALIDQKVRAFVMGVVEAGQQLIPVLGKAVEALGNLIDYLGGADKALYAAAAGLAAMQLATIAATNPWLALAAATTAAGMALGKYLAKAKAMNTVGVTMSTAIASMTAGLVEEKERKRDALEAQKKEENRKRVAGFAPELLVGAGENASRSATALDFEDYIGQQIRKKARKAAKKAESGGVDRGDAEAFARRSLESRRLLARQAASEAFLSGKGKVAARKAIDRVLGGGAKRKGRSGRGRRTAPRREQNGAQRPRLGVDEMLERDFGRGVGGGGSVAKVRPSLGTTINRITNDYRPQVTQQYTVVQRLGESSESLARRVGEVVDAQLGQVFARGYQHFKGATSL